MSPSRISGQERRDQILTKAAELFATHGFEGTKFWQIAEACHISEGVVFHFYKNKRELHIAAFSHIINDDPVLDLPVNKEREKAFQIIAQNILTKCREEPTFLRFLLQIFLSEPGLTRLYYESEAINNFIKFIKRKIDEGKNKGEYRAVDTNFAVVGFIGIIIYCAMSYEFFGPETVKNQSPDKLAKKTVDLFLNGLKL
ncbi:MAG: TetR/AcrR family transcriptional regulator [Deltaproteobacteria bacterium]|nr:TetR/AcrR family transcriptional regulator [Deltaproteobacteria bacterium]